MSTATVQADPAALEPPETFEVAIVGAGFGGLCMAIRLLQQGERRFVVLEKGDEVGGTWRDNSYPGAECDVQSHLYSYSFAGKADWSQRYAGWAEIQQYILDTTERYGVRPHVRFRQTVAGLRYDQASAHWHVALASGGTLRARHVVLATGPLHVPHLPSLPGIERFRGKVFHSAQWDHGYDLAGKRVASIGTGGSAIQYCPRIAPQVARLHVFQRTAAWVIPRDTRSYSDGARRRFARFDAWRRLHRARLYWTNESRVWPIFHPALARGLQRLARWNLRRAVGDDELARRLTPDYTIGCKRVLISNEWYPMFRRDNVELVTAGIRELREHSIVTDDGIERPVDAIILGTGFVVDPRIYMQHFPVHGLPGHELAQDWRAGAEAYYGISVAGYPNLHQLVGPNTALGHNSIIFMIEAQVRYVLRVPAGAARAGRGQPERPAAGPGAIQRSGSSATCAARSGAPAAAAGTSRPTAATSRSGRIPPGATGSRRAASTRRTTASTAPRRPLPAWSTGQRRTQPARTSTWS